jgi:hypothetical protein
MIYELTAKDISWLMEAIEDFREDGHNETANMLDEKLQKILFKEKHNKT